MLANDPPDRIGLLMYDISRQMRLRFDARVRDLGVTRSQWRALLMLARGLATTSSELADRLDVERITACRLIDRMVDAGLVERMADPSDRRVWRLHLTDRARAISDDLATRAQVLEQEMLAVLEPAEVKGFQAALEKLRAGLREGNRGSLGEKAA